MGEEIAYALITPGCVRKARTGGILARLLSRTTLDLAAVQVVPFSLSDASVLAGARWLETPDGLKELEWRECVRGAFSAKKNEDGRVPAALLVVVRGPLATALVQAAAGGFLADEWGEGTVRGTFGELVRSPTGCLLHCEPAVITGTNPASIRTALEFFAKLPRPVLSAPSAKDMDWERTLVLIKPDNFQFPGGRAGNILDFFSREGLRLAGARIVNFSPGQALRFYAPVRDALKARLMETAGRIAAKELATGELALVADAALVTRLGKILGPVYGEQRFQNLIRFMSGRSADECPVAEMEVPGTEKTVALVFEGESAVLRMRQFLGPTDPAQARPGTARREFGTSVLVNAAHASDSVENAAREIEIIQPWESDLPKLLGTGYKP